MDASALDSAISALEKSISALEPSIDSLEPWLWASTVAVVVGVALELYFVIHRYRCDMRSWRRGTIRSPEKPSRALCWGELASIVLVVLGVAGELCVGVLSANKNFALRTKQDLLGRLVREKASHAETTAGAANERVGQANGHVVKLEASNRQLGINLEAERQKTARFQKEAADAQLAVKSYIDVLAKSANPRFTNFDAKRFIGILTGKPKGIVETIWYESDDIEAYQFATTLRGSLGSEGARWDVGEVRPLEQQLDIGKALNERERTDLQELRIEALDTGLAIGSNEVLQGSLRDKDTALGALTDAIDFGTGGWNTSGVRGHWTRPMPSLAPNHFLIAVGHHRVNVPLWIPTWQHTK